MRGGTLNLSKSDHIKIEISTGYINDQENKQDTTAEKNYIRNANFMESNIDTLCEKNQQRRFLIKIFVSVFT